MELIVKSGFFLLKTGCMLMLFGVIKVVIKFVFGSRLDFIIDNFPFFVIAGLIPAVIAKFKGGNFWIWWLGGAFFPIMSTIIVLSLSREELELK